MNERNVFCKWNWNNREKRKKLVEGLWRCWCWWWWWRLTFIIDRLLLPGLFLLFIFNGKKYRSSFYFSILQQKISFFFFRKITRWSELIDLRKKMYLACLNKTDDQSCLSKHQHFAWSKDSFTNRTFARFEAIFFIKIGTLPIEMKLNVK